MNVARFAEIECMKRPGIWPHWPILELKRKTETFTAMQFGMLKEHEDDFGWNNPPVVKPIVYLTNTIREVASCKIVEYEDFDKLWDDGWRIDGYK